MAMQKASIAIVLMITAISVMVGTLGALVATRTISNSGSITAIGVGVYSNSGCSTVLSTIGWGTLNPGNVANYTMYVKNTGNSPVTLNMTVNSWSLSSAPSYISLTWNQEKSRLTAGQVVPAVLTLSVSSSISNVTSFSFNIIITGTQSQ
jgi:uncharacterized repeat protein (TIGR01451 family)